MFHDVLRFFAKELNSYLRLKFGVQQDMVVLSNLINQDGKPALTDKNKIVMSLINMEEERVTRPMKNYIRSGGNNYSEIRPPLKLYLYIMFTAYFEGENYEEALKFIYGVASFFQSHPVFNSKQYPQLGNGAERITVDFVNTDFDKLGRMWAVMGNKYLPSMVFRFRTFIIQENVITGQASGVAGMK